MNTARRYTQPAYRQIHLDFHTSECITGVGADFDPDEFAGTLEAAAVDSILLFARCHHGWLYYHSSLMPEREHPHLMRNLLKDQIAACHARGIRTPIYTTVQWDVLLCEEHPEWRIVGPDGRLEGTPPYEAGFYRKLCLNSPFRDFIKLHTADIMNSLPIDGLYFDFIRPDDCSCRWCRARMEAEGLDSADRAARVAFGLRTVNEFEAELARFVRERDSECSITYNGGHIGLRHRVLTDAYTHFELETIPSGGWGYSYFPVTVRYARRLGPGVMGTTGKFHSSWGDFHSLKNRAALEYEVFRMLAMGARCCIGDQLHPSGRLDPGTYELVGSVYRQVVRKEPWTRDASPVCDIGVFTPEEFEGASARSLPPSIQGVTRILEEGAHQFDILDSTSDLDRYRVLILPDRIPVTPAFAARLDDHLAGGGGLIASFESGLSPDGAAFGLAALGVDLASDGERDGEGQPVRGRVYERNDFADYVRPRSALAEGLPEAEQPMYMRGTDIVARDGSDVLADKVRPWFDRSWRHYSSHLQAPSTGKTGGPAVVRKGRAIYFAHPIFRQYEENAPLWCKRLFLNALDLLLPDPLIRHTGPSTLLITVNSQEQERRWVVHLLHYIPERRGRAFDTIEDVIPLRDVGLSVRLPHQTRSVELVPDRSPLAFEVVDGRVELRVPVIEGHTIVALAY